MTGDKIRVILIASMLLAILALTSTALAAEPCSYVHSDGRPASCVDIRFASPGLIGDFYLGNQLLTLDTGPAVGVEGVKLFLYPEYAETTVTITIKNIKEPANPAAGGEYGYADYTQKVTTPPAGFGEVYVITPAKINLSKPVIVPCDLKSYKGEAITCGVTVNGMAKAPIAPGQKATYNLPKGTHTIVITLLGELAVTALWSPASITKTVGIYAPSTYPTTVVAPFNKSAHLIYKLDKEGVLGDFYVNGVRVAMQVATYDQWVTSYKSYKIEVKNLTDPVLGPGVWILTYPAYVYPAPGAEKTVTLKLKSAPMDIKALIGTWKGVANTSDGTQFVMSFSFTSYPPCTYGGVCGTFQAARYACSGQVRMISLVNGVYTWVNANATAGCAPPGSGIDTLALNADGTLHYNFTWFSGGWADGTLMKAQTPVDITQLIGTWVGTANTSEGTQFQIAFTFNSNPLCVAGGVCGTFKVPEFNCSGQVRMISLVNGVYTWENANATSGCAPPGSGLDTLTLNPDGTLRYNFTWFSGGWADGILTKNAP